MVAVALLMAGCATEDEPQQISQQSVPVDFALTVAKSVSPGSSGTTRMTSANTLGSADNIVLQCAIPFEVADANVPIAITDRYVSEPITNIPRVPAFPLYFTSSCNFNAGVNAILAYARPTENNIQLYKKGKLDITFNGYQPTDIGFRLKPIQTKDEYYGITENTDEETVPEQLADYLTAIANTSVGENTWSETMNTDLKLLFKNFTNQLSDEVGEVLPGSSANIKAWVTALWTQLNGLTSLTGDDASIRDAIKANIQAKLDVTTTPKDWKTDYKTAWDGFPASKFLPDGAAVVRWDGTAFVCETQTTTIADINNLERFTYPAEIYYYGNSPTMVADEDLSGNFSSKNKWEKENESDNNAVLSGFTQGPVSSTTKTVAMRDPLQYGVAQLAVKLKQTASKLPDSKSDDTDATKISVGTNKFKLTGVIVGGQLPVGFDFSPETIYPSYSEADMSFIYDSEVNTNGTGSNEPFYLSSEAASITYTTQTLVLQSYWRRSLKLVLEFENNSDVDFKGFNGYVYKGTKFYLVGEITPTPVDVNAKVYDNRVFTKDHVTTVDVTVKSLAKAYNVLPNLMSPRLEMGLELTPQWVQATTTDVIL